MLERDRRVVSVLCRSGATPDYACIGGTFTFPEYRQRGLGKHLCAFLITELLHEVSAVQLIVVDDNLPAIALYRSLGFTTVAPRRAGRPSNRRTQRAGYRHTRCPL
ncbi:MAG: GNAT family N-acetyltransferase [bacterium]|nr:GNAT family N-acetyltransferase [bacterium]